MEQVLLTQGTHGNRVAAGGAITAPGFGARGSWTRLLGRVVVAPTALGLLLGAVAAVADGSGGSIGIVLSLPGAWIATAVVVTGVVGRDRAYGSRRAGASAAAMALFLAAGILAYYAGKDTLTHSVPSPVAVFWLTLAAGVGLAGGATTAWITARSWGPAALIGGIGGWLVAEALAVPSAPWGEAALALFGVAAITFVVRPGRPTAWIAGCAVGAAGSLLVLDVLPSVLSQLA